MTWQERIHAWKREQLTQAVAQHASISAAAKALGMNRTMIYRLADELGVALPKRQLRAADDSAHWAQFGL